MKIKKYAVEKTVFQKIEKINNKKRLITKKLKSMHKKTDKKEIIRSSKNIKIKKRVVS